MKVRSTVFFWLLSQALVWACYLWVAQPLFPAYFAAPGEEGFLVTVLVNCLLPLIWVIWWQRQWRAAEAA